MNQPSGGPYSDPRRTASIMASVGVVLALFGAVRHDEFMRGLGIMWVVVGIAVFALISAFRWWRDR